MTIYNFEYELVPHFYINIQNEENDFKRICKMEGNSSKQNSFGEMSFNIYRVKIISVSCPIYT
jgi:hypothetical protein